MTARPLLSLLLSCSSCSGDVSCRLTGYDVKYGMNAIVETRLWSVFIIRNRLLLLLCGYFIVSNNGVLLLLSGLGQFNHCLFFVIKTAFY